MYGVDITNVRGRRRKVAFGGAKEVFESGGPALWRVSELTSHRRDNFGSRLKIFPMCYEALRECLISVRYMATWDERAHQC